MRAELDNCFENDSGQLVSEPGCYDDKVMASGMFAVSEPKAAVMTTPRAILEQQVEPDPFLIENIIDECRDITYWNKNRKFKLFNTDIYYYKLAFSSQHRFLP